MLGWTLCWWSLGGIGEFGKGGEGGGGGVRKAVGFRGCSIVSDVIRMWEDSVFRFLVFGSCFGGKVCLGE